MATASCVSCNWMGNTSPCPVCGAPVAYDENFDEYEQPDEEEKEVIDED